MLLFVARFDTPNTFAQFFDADHFLLRIIVATESRLAREIFFDGQIFVGMQRWICSYRNAAFGEKGIDDASVDAEIAIAMIQLVDRNFFRFKIDGVKAKRIATDAHVDVFGYQNRRMFAIGITHFERCLKDALVHVARVVAWIFVWCLGKHDANRAAVFHFLSVRQTAL
jgi:hypothetical protein